MGASKKQKQKILKKENKNKKNAGFWELCRRESEFPPKVDKALLLFFRGFFFIFYLFWFLVWLWFLFKVKVEIEELIWGR